MARRAGYWGSARQAMPHPMSGQSVEEATAVGGMAQPPNRPRGRDRRTPRRDPSACPPDRTIQGPRATSGPRAAGPGASVRRAASSHDIGARAYKRPDRRRAAGPASRPPRGRVEGPATSELRGGWTLRAIRKCDSEKDQPKTESHRHAPNRPEKNLGRQRRVRRTYRPASTASC